MALLRKYNPQEVVRYTSDEGDWIELRSEFSQREVKTLMKKMKPNMTDIEVDEAMSFQEDWFLMSCTAWSLGAKPSTEEFLDLPPEGARWCNTVLGEHFKSLFGDKVADDAKKPES